MKEAAFEVEPTIKTAEDLWRDTFDVSLRLVEDLKFDGNNEVHRYFMALYATILEQNCSAIALRAAGSYAGIKQILRSNLEAYVDLCNLLRDSRYIDNLKFEYHRQWIKLAKAGIQGDNDFLASFRDNQDVRDLLDRHGENLRALRKKGVKKKMIEQKFEDAGLMDVYRSVYNSLSAEGHNDLRALVSRHFFKVEGGDVQIRLFEPPSREAVASTVDQFLGILLDSGVKVHRALKAETAAQALMELHNLRVALADR